MASRQVVLVTGCASGVGLAAAERLARDPDKRFQVIATVVALDQKTDLVAAVGDALDDTVIIKELDITKDQQIFDIVCDVHEQYGDIDILVNVAGVAPCTHIEAMSRSDIELTFSVNTIGIIRLAQAVLPRMKRREKGKIITVTSNSARIGVPLLEVYSASKAGTEGFFEALTPTVRELNIGISIIEPGSILTGMLDAIANSMEEMSENESLIDVDKRHARAFGTKCRDTTYASKPSDVVDAILKCIEEPRPVFRYQVPEALGQMFSVALSDSTGETGISFAAKVIK